MLVLKDINKYYGEKHVVQNLNLEIKKGQMVGILGSNGAGKTTTFRMILGIISQNSGTIKFNDEEITLDISDKIGFLTEERSLLLGMKVGEQISYFARLKGMKDAQIKSECAKWLEYFSIEEYEKMPLKSLSKGNQQKVQFITSIIHKPELLILDEPFSGLDPIDINLFKEAMIELKNNGTAILFSSHRMDHVEYFCEDFLIIQKGKTIAKGKVDDYKKNSELKYVELVCDIDPNEVEGVEGVLRVENEKDTTKVFFSDHATVDKVFDVVKTCNWLRKFQIVYPSLEEIFIHLVGEHNE